MSLLYIGQQFTIYTGLCVLIAGLAGNAINVLIFSSVRTYRTTPCTFYYLAGSIDNIFYILLNLLTRILSEGFGINVTGTSNAWCKIREYLLITPSILSTTFSCLAAIDQSLVTSKIALLWRYSTMKWAYRFVIIAIIIWCLHGIPILLFFEISPINGNACKDMNADFSIYALVYLLGLICAIPIIIMSICGWLTYRNIHRTIVLAEQRADRQLVRMTLVQVGLVIIGLLPYGIFNVYALITATVTKGIDRLMIENMVFIIVSMMTYLFYGVCY